MESKSSISQTGSPPERLYTRFDNSSRVLPTPKSRSPGPDFTYGSSGFGRNDDQGRFASVGNYASDCRCVGSTHVSNGRQKGKGNTKNGNQYLAWAYVEAANFAMRYDPQIKRWYQRKCAKTKRVVAIKAVAHKLARACYHSLRDGSACDVNRAFA